MDVAWVQGGCQRPYIRRGRLEQPAGHWREVSCALGALTAALLPRSCTACAQPMALRIGTAFLLYSGQRPISAFKSWFSLSLLNMACS